MFKSKSQYSNESWDLVDASKNKKSKIRKLKKEELPQEMRDMSLKEREEYVGKKAKERKRIQKKIQKLSKERNKYIAKERKKQATSGKITLETAIIKIIHSLGKKKGFKF